MTTKPKTEVPETDSLGASSPGPVVDLSPQASVRPAGASESVHNLETHDLSAREQLMRQWPLMDLEKR